MSSARGARCGTRAGMMVPHQIEQFNSDATAYPPVRAWAKIRRSISAGKVLGGIQPLTVWRSNSAGVDRHPPTARTGAHRPKPPCATAATSWVVASYQSIGLSNQISALNNQSQIEHSGALGFKLIHYRYARSLRRRMCGSFLAVMSNTVAQSGYFSFKVPGEIRPGGLKKVQVDVTGFELSRTLAYRSDYFL